MEQIDLYPDLTSPLRDRLPDIVHAADLLRSTGGTIYLHAGVYHCSGTFREMIGVILRGVDPERTLVKVNAPSATPPNE